MAAPTFVGAGTLAIWQSGAAVTLSKTSCTAGNIIFVHVLIDGTDTVTLSSITNISNLAGSAGALDNIETNDFIIGNPGAAEAMIQVGRATANGTCSVGIASGGVDLYGIIWECTGASTGTTQPTVMENGSVVFDGSFPTDAITTRATSGTLGDHDVVTNGPDRLALNFISVNDDNQAFFDTEAFTGQSGGTWVCRGGFGSSTGTDGSVGLQSAAMASAGTIGGGSLAMDSDAWGVVGLALIGTTADVSLFPNPTIFQDPGLF